MATQFPTAPTNGRVYQVDGISYIYRNTTDTFEKVASFGTSGSSFSLISPPNQAGTANAFFNNIQIHDNIFTAWNNNAGIFRTFGGNMGNTTTYQTTLWNNSTMIQVPLGANNVVTGPGVRITVPAGYNTVWLRRSQNGVACENRLEYVWNNTAGTAHRVRNYAYERNQARLTPAGFFGPFKNNDEHNYGLPLHCDDSLGGTMFVAWISTGNSNTVDNWVSGIAFTDNPHNITTTNAIESWRNDFATSVYNSGFGERYSQQVANNNCNTNDYIGTSVLYNMQVINSDGRDKIFSITNTPDTLTVWEPKPILRVGNTANTDMYFLGEAMGHGADFNIITQGMFPAVLDGATLVNSWRVPGSLINKFVPVGTRGRMTFALAVGMTTNLVTRTSTAYCFDA
jgi:hypothetical protein